MENSLLYPGAGSGAVIAVMGYLLVFFGIFLLLAVVTLMGKIMVNRRKKADARRDAAATVPAPAGEAPPAPGSAGEIKLYNVSERDAALIMAIVAYRLGKPLNELRFRSIREVQEK